MTAPPLAYRLIRGLFRIVVAVFFRRVEVLGLEHVPRDRGGLLVSWHPNGMVDPGLILTSFPGQVVFGARHGLFRWPLLGLLLRRVGTVPIYRAVDDGRGDLEARRQANQRSLEALAGRIAAGRFSALFPEGVSHDDSRPVEMKSGAARLYYQARAQTPADAPPPAIVPVGLHYDAKDAFRSSALVAFHPPLTLPPALDAAPAPGEDEAAARERARLLTAELERVLHDVVLATEDWPVHRLLHRARALLRAERARRAGAAPDPAGIVEQTVGFARVRAGYLRRRETDPGAVEALRARVEAYDRALRALGLEDVELDRDPRLLSPWLGAIVALQAALVFLLLPPVLVVGFVVNLPTYLALDLLTRATAKLRKDAASIKMLVGALAYPATWLAAGLLAAWGHGRLHAAFPSVPDHAVLAGVFTALTGALGGAVAVRYQRVAGETWRALRVRLTRRARAEAVGRLRAERAALCDHLVALGDGVDLPGALAPDGTVRPA